MDELKIECKFRLTKNGKKVFGEGPCLLLETIDRLGSLSKACEELNMSYSKGWAIINNAEKQLNIKLLHSTIGGIDGGGSKLTPDANKIIKAYRSFSREAEENIDKLFKKYF